MNEFSKNLKNELEAMWGFALRLTTNKADAEDLVQRTCVKALENAHQYQNQGRMRSWLFKIEHRIWLNTVRSVQIRTAGSFKSQPNSTDFAYDEQSDDSNVVNRTGVDHHSPESQLQLHQLYQQVESLPDAQRLVIILVCVNGFSYKETGDILMIPIGTVMSRLARARITLGKKIMANPVLYSGTSKGAGKNAGAGVDGVQLR